MSFFKDILSIVGEGRELSLDQANAAFDHLFSGDVTPAQVGAFLASLHVRGETIDELTGAVVAMRQRMVRVQAPTDAIDMCGTGGDMAATWNISTLASIIVASCGVPVAKHGNKAFSSRSGAADVLTALGVRCELDRLELERCLERAGIAFMFAPVHHPAMKHVASARIEIGFRTLFNLLGPLSNPAGVKRQLIGVYNRKWMRPMAETLARLGSDHVWLVRGMDGLDEITTTGSTEVVSLNGGEIREFSIHPNDVGLALSEASQLRGGTPTENANALLRVVEGERSAYRDISVINAAAGLVIARQVADLREAVAVAERAIDSGAARDALTRLVEASNSGR